LKAHASAPAKIGVGPRGAGLAAAVHDHQAGSSPRDCHKWLRFTTDIATRDQMIAKGWLLEGSGPGFATMCVPQ
jgi:hypothetical protein